MILYLVAIIAVLVLCYFLSRFVAKKMNNGVSGTKIKIIERVALGQDKGLAICKVCGRYYLIGIASQNVKILAELDPQFFLEDESPAKGSFLEMMNQALKKNKQP